MNSALRDEEVIVHEFQRMIYYQPDKLVFEGLKKPPSNLISVGIPYDFEVTANDFTDPLGKKLFMCAVVADSVVISGMAKTDRVLDFRLITGSNLFIDREEDGLRFEVYSQFDFEPLRNASEMVKAWNDAIGVLLEWCEPVLSVRQYFRTISHDYSKATE